MVPSLPTLISGVLFVPRKDMTLTAWPKYTSLRPKSDGVILCEEKKTLPQNTREMNELKQVIWTISHVK